MYISNESEIDLLKALGPKHWWLSLLNKIIGSPVNRKRTLLLMAQKSTNPDKDSYLDIQKFLKKHNIKYTAGYWPGSDRF